MARDTRTIDVTQEPTLLRLAEEVQRTGESLVLQRAGEDLAVLTPSARRRRAPAKARHLTRDDALFSLIGIGESAVPGGVSGKKHEALAKAYRHR